jgi:hypothetical protein
MEKTQPAFPPNVFPGAPVRADALQFIVSCLAMGECCAVVGPSNTGKSLLLRALLAEEVRARLRRPGGSPPLVLFVDCLDGVGDTERDFYELLFRRIIEEAEGAIDASTVDLEATWELHGELLRSTTPTAVRSLFARGVHLLSHAGTEKRQSIIVLDEFDDVFRTLPPWPFRHLRALRDAFGSRHCYVTGTSRYLGDLRADADTYEFRELFQVHTYTLRPLSPADSVRMLDHLAQKQGLVLPKPLPALVIRLSGGHPGLLHRIAQQMQRLNASPDTSTDAAIRQLLATEPIQEECKRLWSELESHEQAGLLALVTAGVEALSPDQQQALQAKGLTKSTPAGEVVFGDLFAAFVRDEARRHRKIERGVRCDSETGQIWVDGREVTLELSELQRKLVRFLYEQIGQICTQQQIIERVWKAGAGVSPGAIYELVKRVRKKIEVDWRHPRYLVTVPGEGYRLEKLE